RVVAICSSILMLVCVFFFFFQAEDGIRDLYVTGVQTCALPICDRFSAHDGDVFEFDESWSQFPILTGYSMEMPSEIWLVRHGERSEERRVGKECRSRWWPDQ